MEMNMNHGHKFMVKWHEKRSKWLVLEESPSGKLYVLENYRTKEPAKKHARTLARKEDAKTEYYSKDSAEKERVTYRKDYS